MTGQSNPLQQQTLGRIDLEDQTHIKYTYDPGANLLVAERADAKNAVQNRCMATGVTSDMVKKGSSIMHRYIDALKQAAAAGTNGVVQVQ